MKFVKFVVKNQLGCFDTASFPYLSVCHTFMPMSGRPCVCNWAGAGEGLLCRGALARVGELYAFGIVRTVIASLKEDVHI